MWVAATKSGTERSSYKWDGGEEWKWPTEEGWTPTWCKYLHLILAHTQCSFLTFPSDEANNAGEKCLVVNKNLEWVNDPCTHTHICLCRV